MGIFNNGAYLQDFIFIASIPSLKYDYQTDIFAVVWCSSKITHGYFTPFRAFFSLGVERIFPQRVRARPGVQLLQGLHDR
jgi:hypothetical protein